MRILLLLGWLLLGVGLVLWHRGPGQERLRLDDAGQALARAARHATAEEWPEAIGAYEEALGRLPAEKVDAVRRIRLARALAQLKAKKLQPAYEGLKALCGEMQADRVADRALLAEARAALAQAHYYTTWVLRLQGEPREEWEPEIESARQIYRLLAEQAGERGDETSRRRHLEDLEVAVRLARLDLSDLARMPSPGGGSGGKRSARARDNSSRGEKPQDARGAGSGPPPDTGGH
jgi:hypothetical protein